MSVTQRKIGGRTFAVYTAVANHMDDLTARLAESEAECLEQARLNGMGSEREARLIARLAEAERDAARIEWLASNPRGGQIVVDGKTQDCVFWGISGHPRATLRDAIDAARATDSATSRETANHGRD